VQEDAVREARTKLQGLQKEKDDAEKAKDNLRAKIARVGQPVAVFYYRRWMVTCGIWRWRRC
jgi:hypothetical protein